MTRLTDKTVRGFALIELMVTVAIVGILATIAYPVYLHQLIEGRRSAAEATLMDIAQREQQYFLDARQYATGTSASSLTTIPSSVTNFYTIAVNPGASSATFTATATPISGSAQASDGPLSIDQSGNKTGNW